MAIPTLQQLLADYPNHQSTENALFEKSRRDIERSSLANQESLFGRGLGLSTIQGEIERQRGEALSQARRDAFLAAQQAQLNAYAQAAQQQQFQQNLAQRQSEASSLNKFRRQQLAEKSNDRLFQAGGALGGAALQLAGKTFAPEISGGLRSLFGMGSGPMGPGETRVSGQLGGLPQPGPAAQAPAIEAPAAAPFSEMPKVNLSEPGELPMPSIDGGYAGGVEMPDFNWDALAGGGGLEQLYWGDNWGDYL